ncbi:hypothetical protein C8R45DRAFT_936469 [Mycena sanguinolenta]|nr:hypothetical protein C8R45DRAFT_936469 [Mycena sanguinolenta]
MPFITYYHIPRTGGPPKANSGNIKSAVPPPSPPQPTSSCQNAKIGLAICSGAVVMYLRNTTECVPGYGAIVPSSKPIIKLGVSSGEALYTGLASNCSGEISKEDGWRRRRQWMAEAEAPFCTVPSDGLREGNKPLFAGHYAASLLALVSSPMNPRRLYTMWRAVMASHEKLGEGRVEFCGNRFSTELCRNSEIKSPIGCNRGGGAVAVAEVPVQQLSLGHQPVRFTGYTRVKPVIDRNSVKFASFSQVFG